MQETWVWSLGQEDSLEKEMATHSNILAWKISWTKSLIGPLLSMRSQRADTTEQLHWYWHISSTWASWWLKWYKERIRLQCERPGFDPWVRYHTKSCTLSFIAALFEIVKKLEVTQLSSKGWMVRHVVVHLYHEILLGNKTEWTINTCNNLDGSHGIMLSEKVNSKKLHTI